MKITTEHEWYHLVKLTIEEHPDWIGVTSAALMVGAQARIQSETDARANAETALTVCLPALDKDKVPEHQRNIVRSAIKNSKCFGGTAYAEAI